MTDPGRARKPVYKRVWFWLLVVIAVIVIAAVAGGGGGESKGGASGGGSTVSAPAPAPAPSSSVAPAPVQPTTEIPASTPATSPAAQPPASAAADDLSDDEWVASDIQVERSQFGDSITGRVRNDADGPRTGVFTLTVFDAAGKRIGETTGSASSVAPGETNTVTFVGTSQTLPGDPATYHFEFQSDF